MGQVRERTEEMLELTFTTTGEVEKIIRLVQPYLIVKKPQANLMLEVLKKQKKVNSDQEFLEVCKEIDKFEKLNGGKRRTNRAEVVERHQNPPVET